MSKKKELLKNTFIIFVGKTSTQLISFFLLPLYTAYLSKAEYGIVDLIQTYVTLLVPIISLQSGMSLFRALVDSREDNKKSGNLIKNNFYIIFIMLLIFSILYFIFCLFVDIPYKLLIYFTVIACVLSDDLLQVARGIGDNLDYSISCIITGIVTIVSNIILICFLGYRDDGMIFSLGFANLVCSIYLFIKLKLYKHIKIFDYDKSIVKKMLKYSLPLVPNSTCWWIINASNRSIVSHILGTAFNGIYAISNKFPTILSAFLGIFNLSWSESSALHINARDRESFFSETIDSALKLFGSIGLLLITFMPFIFPIFINQKFAEAINYIPILVLAYVFNVVIVLYTGIYIGLKKTKEVTTTTVFGAITNVLIALLFVKRFKLYAAAFATFMAYFVMMIYRVIDLKRYMKITYSKRTIISLIISFTIAIFFYYLDNLYFDIAIAFISLIYVYYINRGFIKDILDGIKSRLIRFKN